MTKKQQDEMIKKLKAQGYMTWEELEAKLDKSNEIRVANMRKRLKKDNYILEVK